MQFDSEAGEAFDRIAQYLEKPGNPIEEIQEMTVFEPIEKKQV